VFLKFASEALRLDENTISEVDRFICFDFYDSRGVKKNPPALRHFNFVFEGRPFLRKTTPISIHDSHIVLEIEIKDLDLDSIVMREVHKLSVFDYSFMEIKLKEFGFEIVASLDPLLEQSFAGDSYGNCIIAKLI